MPSTAEHVTRSGVKMPALVKWTDEYLRRTMGPARFGVAVTPNGYDLFLWP